MLNRRAFLCGSVVTALVTRRGVEAQQVPKVPQIGVLANIRSSSTEGFLDGLRERGYIEAALMITQGNLTQAAKLLGIHRTTLYSRMQNYADSGGEAAKAARPASK